ncbi:GNAT family N-acetyltransferase [Ruegeria arenilitoris]|uniref:GNAT family N-acetyltransferase n=1 Tax=Ruegeria arenilitoris TaxID=1173585 RepID=UPI00147DA8EA
MTRNEASVAQLAALLTACDLDFCPPLSQRQDIPAYAERIFERAERFECWDQGQLVGLVAIYCITPPGEPAFITNVSVHPSNRGCGLADALLHAALTHARSRGFSQVALEVDAAATAAQHLYYKHNFSKQSAKGATLLLHVAL